MALGQLLRSTRLIKTLLEPRLTHLECLCRCASTATVLISNRIQPTMPVGLLSLATNEKKQAAIEMTSSSKKSVLGFERVSIAPTPLPSSFSSRLITDCILPGSNFIFGRGAIYTVPLGYRRAHLEDTIGDVPLIGPVVKRDPEVSENSTVQEPSHGLVQEKQAARLITIRRKKMKKHKLRKLRKKMHFVWAKVRQRREALKRKIFENELLTRMALSDDFDAEAWVHEFLRKATTDPTTLIKKTPPPMRPTRYVFE